MSFLTQEEADEIFHSKLIEVQAVLGPDRPGKAFRGPVRSPEATLPLWVWDKLAIAATVDSVAGERWLHVSVSNPKRMPSHPQLCRVREAFFDKDSVVVAIFPPEAEYVNLHKHVLHLWERLDGPRLVPDMRKMGYNSNVYDL